MEGNCAKADEAGIQASTDYTEVAKDVDFIVTALPTGAIVKDCLTREGGILDVGIKGLHICDVSTVSPQESVFCANAAQAAGMNFLDTPMAGGVPGAQAGSLTFMVGGTEEELSHVKPMLMGMGKKYFHCGGPGTGAVAKLSNNMILASTMIATCEAMAFGEKNGADPQTLVDIWKASSAASFVT